jgi:lipoprotein-anchoring transpeptidase ErfK/SrfK
MSQLADTPRRGRRRALLIVAAVLAVLALVLTGGALGYAKSFEGKALPGTTVAGEDVSGKTADEISALVADKAEGVTVTVTADGTDHEVSLADLGVSVDADATGAAATEHDTSLREVIPTLWSGTRDVAPVMSIDDEAVATYAKSLIPEDRTAPQDATLKYDEDSGEWKVTEGVEGQGIKSTELADAVTANASDLSSFSVEQTITKQEPGITTDEAESTKADIEKMLEQSMSIEGADGQTHEISKDLRSGWLKVSADKKGESLTVSVDEDAVADWVSEQADEDSTEAKDGIEQVDSDGETVKVVAEKQDGTKVSNTDKVTSEIVSALTGKSPLEARFETETVKADVTKVDAPSDDEDESGESDDAADATGEKWIDVNLSDKTATAYVGDTPVWGPRSIVDGKEGNETATGSYEIYLRYEMQDMTNGDRYDEDDPRYYYTEDVPWVQYWHNGYAFHGAPWRSSFGYSGSHGCINMTVSDAKWLWDWADVGVRVESHY